MTFLKNTYRKKPFVPKKLSKVTLFLDNLIATRSYCLSTNLVDTKNVIDFQLSSNCIYNSKKLEKVIHLRLWGREVILVLSQWPMLEELQEYISEKELEKLPEDVALITLSVVFSSLIKTLSEKLSTNVELIKFYLCDGSRVNQDSMAKYFLGEVFSIPFNFGLKEVPRIETRLLFDKKILRHILSAINKIPSIPNLSTYNISTPVYVEYGACFLKGVVISSIEYGDVLMIDSPISAKNHLKLRFISKQFFLVKKQDNSKSYELLEELTMEDNKLKRNIPLKDIPLLITFDLGKISIPLKEVEKLGVGYTLNIQKEFTDLVTLRIDNQAIGKGELVYIGDRVGVRITEVTSRK